MKKFIAVAIVLAFGLVPALAGTTQAEKMHAAKPVWQGILAALTVFDMARVATISPQLAGREKFFSTLEFLPQVVRDRLSKVGDMAAEMAKPICDCTPLGAASPFAKP